MYHLMNKSDIEMDTRRKMCHSNNIHQNIVYSLKQYMLNNWQKSRLCIDQLKDNFQEGN